MFGLQREQPYPMCTSLMGTLDNKMPDVAQRMAFVIVARAPIERLVAVKPARGAPDIDPLWTMLDKTPDRRGKGWYPKLSSD